jgi:hypothetical protein
MRRASQLLATIDWATPNYSAEKAFVTSVFAKIAYLHIPDFEVSHHPLAKIIPCQTYHELIATTNAVDVQALIQQAEFGASFVITRSYVVIVGAVTSSVVIVALRGTRPFYLSDWKIDLTSGKILTYVNAAPVKWHSGFFSTITNCLEEIHQRIASLCNPHSLPIYLVGHSLGGALAAIGHALGGTAYYSALRYGGLFEANPSHSSFTFGMPRYGNDSVLALRTPFHTYNENDLVPGLPPSWLGFATVPTEYCATLDGKLEARAARQRRILG